MLNQKLRCPVCLNSEGGSCTPFSNSPALRCDICGYVRLDRSLYARFQGGEVGLNAWRLTTVQRAVLSHRIRTNSPENPPKESDLFMITSDLLDSLPTTGGLPNLAEQAANIVRFVGDSVSGSGDAIRELPVHIHATIGALTRESAVRLMDELVERRILRSEDTAAYYGGPHGTIGLSEPAIITLSLDGWQQYESQRRGSYESNYGFIAMQFNESDLEDFVQNVVKPTVKNATGYDLVDMGDVATAGIIDNIMRVRIKEARFIIADLTHDNRGAYWEAGYAEGLGKPVIYICEAEKFEREKSHFDTNHCTTIPWSRDDDETFKQRLTATLRRSLDLSG